MIAAVVLAAGLSRRMGRPKMILPWGNTTVIGKVVDVLSEAGIEQILVVTGGARAEVEKALEGLPARPVYNPEFKFDQMSLSLKVGLKALSPTISAALVALGDQPQIEVDTVRKLKDAYENLQPSLIVPSYRSRRGHPWIVARSLWKEILYLNPPRTLRDFMQGHADQIHYVEVKNDSIFRDLDTDADYLRERPE